MLAGIRAARASANSPASVSQHPVAPHRQRRAGGVDQGVPDLAGIAGRPEHRLAVVDDPGADAHLSRKVDEVANPDPGTPAVLGECAQVGLVGHRDPFRTPRARRPASIRGARCASPGWAPDGRIRPIAGPHRRRRHRPPRGCDRKGATRAVARRAWPGLGPSPPGRTAPGDAPPAACCRHALPARRWRPRSSPPTTRGRAPRPTPVGRRPAARAAPALRTSPPGAPRPDRATANSATRSAMVERLSPAVTVSSERESGPERCTRSRTVARLCLRSSSAAIPRRGAGVVRLSKSPYLLGTSLYSTSIQPVNLSPNLRLAAEQSSGSSSSLLRHQTYRRILARGGLDRHGGCA